MNKFKFGLLAIALFASFGAAAQSTSNSSTTASAQTAPVANTNNIIFPNSTPSVAGTVLQPGQSFVEQSGSVKTTGQAFLPGMSVASGSFNCGATGGLAIGGQGFSVSAGGAKSLKDCVALNLMNFASLSKDEELYVALLCTMDVGKEAMTALKRPCPDGSKQQITSAPPAYQQTYTLKEATPQPVPAVAVGNADQRNLASGMRPEEKLRWIGADLKDPYIARRAPQ